MKILLDKWIYTEKIYGRNLNYKIEKYRKWKFYNYVNICNFIKLQKNCGHQMNSTFSFDSALFNDIISAIQEKQYVILYIV